MARPVNAYVTIFCFLGQNKDSGGFINKAIQRMLNYLRYLEKQAKIMPKIIQGVYNTMASITFSGLKHVHSVGKKINKQANPKGIEDIYLLDVYNREITNPSKALKGEEREEKEKTQNEFLNKFLDLKEFDIDYTLDYYSQRFSEVYNANKQLFKESTTEMLEKLYELNKPIRQAFKSPQDFINTYLPQYIEAAEKPDDVE